MCERFLAKGHVVLLRHLLRSREVLDWRPILDHYERVAFELRNIAWRSRGPFEHDDSVDVFLIRID